MPEAVLKQAAAPLRDLRSPLQENPPIVPAPETNDNESSAEPRVGERQMFEMPASVWWVMVGCYGVFLAALLGGTGGGHASFAIAISLVYVIMFFGTARAMLGQAPPQTANALDRTDGVLQTASGPLSIREVRGQVLIVPGVVALLGIGFAILSGILL